MKKNVLAVLALILLTTTGCHKVLDKEPLPTISPDNFFRTTEDAEAALAAAYDGIQQTGLYGQDLIMAGEQPSDNCTTQNTDVLPLDKITWNPLTSQVGNIFRQSYISINRANAVIQHVPRIVMDTTRRAQIVAEAKALRALNYFNLVQYYGDVPLRLPGDESVALPRTSADKLYERIIQDLIEAEAGAARTYSSQDMLHGRFTKGGCNALLARVHLTQRNWSAAQEASRKVITSGIYSLLTDFNSAFPADNKVESVFEVEYAGLSQDGGNTVPDLVLPSPPATYSFPKFMLPTSELISQADSNRDARWKNSGPVAGGRSYGSYLRGTSSNAADQGFFAYKWRGNPNGFNSADNNSIIRYADVLLMYAEAANEIGGPSDDVLEKLNAVRVRARLPALDLSFSQTADKASMRKEIELQRRLELAFEGQRWPDLLRYARHELADPSVDHTVTALDVIAQQKGSPDVNYLYFPLPQSEINNNPKLTQTKGF